jgi:hypothetical protein
MVRALLADRKTQTRRIIKSSGVLPETLVRHSAVEIAGRCGWSFITAEFNGAAVRFDCPYGKPGDWLWVRETFAIESTAEYESILDEGSDSIPEDARDGRPTRRHVVNADEDDGEISAWYTVPRYRATEPDTLLMIKEADEPEDQMIWTPSIFMPRWASRITLEITEVRVQRLQEIAVRDAIAEGPEPAPPFPASAVAPEDYLVGFRDLWESINGKGSWGSNPWVWALTFKRVQP